MSSSPLPGPNWTTAEILGACEGSLSSLALKGIDLFNQGLFFEAHEELELAWREERGAIRDVYRGILQVGLGYYHILRGNYPGAIKMFQRCRNWLTPYPSPCRGIDIEHLRQDYQRAESELIRLGPERIIEFNRAFIRPVVFIDRTILNH
jgi:uncharacterized protein